MSLRVSHLLYAAILVCVLASGCGQFSLPKDPNAYQATSDGKGHLSVKYSYSFQKDVTQDDQGKKFHDFLVSCIGNESCGAMARVTNTGSGEIKYVSAKCALEEQGNKVNVDCTIPVDKTITNFKNFSVKITVVGPDGSSDFDFDSSADIPITQS